MAIGMVAAFLMGGAPGRSLAQESVCKEPNDDPGAACQVTLGAAIQSTIDRPGDVDLFRFVIGESGGRVTLELVDLPADYDLYLIDSKGGVLGQSVREGPSAEGLILTLQAGTYFAVVQSDPAREIDATRPYTLRVTIEAAAATGPEPAPESGSAPGVASASTMPAPPSQRLDRPVLLEDSFDDPANARLPLRGDATGRAELAYVESEYSVRNIDRQPNGPYIGAVFGAVTTDSIVSVDVRLVGDIAGRTAAVFCRRMSVPDLENQITAYRLVISPDVRQFELQRNDRGGRVSLSGRQPSGAVNGGDAWNRLQLSCIGSTITAWVNGQQVASVEDTSYTSGQHAVGIIGPVGPQPRAEARIDNLVVYGP